MTLIKFVILCLLLCAANMLVVKAHDSHDDEGVTEACEEFCEDTCTDNMSTVDDVHCDDEECHCTCADMNEHTEDADHICEELEDPTDECEEFCSDACTNITETVEDAHCVGEECHCVCSDDSDFEEDDLCHDHDDDDDDDEPCFSSETTADVMGKGLVKMVDLKVGDQVLTSEGKYHAIYSLDHRDPSRTNEFLQVYYSENEYGPLELTEKHMLFVDENPNPVPAHALKIGDQVLTTNGPQVVTKISSITRQGVFNPLTAAGTIVANGVITSTYSALLSGSEWVEIAGYRVMSHQDFFTALLKPYSYICPGFSYELCQAKNGRVALVEAAHEFLQHGKKQHEVYKVIVLSLFILLAFSFTFVFSPYGVILAASVALGWRMTAKAMKA